MTHPNGSTERELLTVNETARLFGVTNETVYRWVTQGDIPAVRMGRSVFIVRRRLQALLDGYADDNSPG